MPDIYNDIQIADRDIVLDVAGIPRFIDSLSTVSQDVVHAIMDTGVLVEMVAERSQLRWDANRVKIELLVEEELRVIPGTVKVERDDNDKEAIQITASCLFGNIEITARERLGKVLVEVMD